VEEVVEEVAEEVAEGAVKRGPTPVAEKWVAPEVRNSSISEVEGAVRMNASRRADLGVHW